VTRVTIFLHLCIACATHQDYNACKSPWGRTLSFSIGENVGPYPIIEHLGSGGLATVFKAYHANLDRFMAIRVLLGALLEGVCAHQAKSTAASVE